MNAVKKCLHMCGNSLSNTIAFSLDCLGRPEFADLKTYLVSPNIRPSLKTLKGFEVQHDDLMAQAIKALPLAEHGYSKGIPRGRDSEAFCASQGILAPSYKQYGQDSKREDFAKHHLQRIELL